MTSVPAARQLAKFAAELDLDAVPDEVVERAKHLILDCVGLAFASTAYDFSDTARRMTSAWGDGTVPVLAGADRLSPRDAAVLNGVLVHGLDFDDTHIPAVTHISSSALPAAISSAVLAGGSSADLLLAYLIGSEATARVGLAGSGSLHERGWHPTGLVGAFGASLGAGRALGLGEDELAHAQGIVGSMTSGNLEFLTDGSWTKRIHPGWAAMSGLTAAVYSRNGWSGPPAVYEGRFGFLPTHLAGMEYDESALTAGLGSTWETMRTAVKPYPVCHFNHAFIDSGIALLEQLGAPGGVAPDQIASIEARIHPTPGAVVCEPEASKRRPQNEYDAKFSLHFTLARTLLHGNFTLADLFDDALEDPDTLGLAARVTVSDDPDSRFPAAYSGFVKLTTVDGRTVEHREATNRGHDERPLSHDEIQEKFFTLMDLAPGVSRQDAEAVRDAVMRIGDPSMTALEFAEACAAPSRQ